MTNNIPIRRPFFYDPFYDVFDRSRFFDQHLGHGITHDDDFFIPTSHFPSYHRPTRRLSRFNQDTGFSQVINDREKFEIKLDVQQFAPEELQVKSIDKAITIEGKHEEKQDQYGFISRHFVRRYVLPDDINPENVNCDLSTDGVLMIYAPRVVECSKENEVVIPIIQTGKSAVTATNNTNQRKTSSEENPSEGSS